MTRKDLIMARADAYAAHRYADGAQGSGPDHNDKRTVWAREALQEAVVVLEAQVNTCGSGAGCLHKDARIEALEAEVEVDNRNLEQLSDEVNALRKQLAAAQQAQPEKAIAYFDFQERGFYWAPNTAIGPVPVARKVEPMALYSSHQQAQPERAPSVDPRLNKLQEAVIEMYSDWKKGDFALPRLAQLDLEACFEAAYGRALDSAIEAAIKQGGAA